MAGNSTITPGTTAVNLGNSTSTVSPVSLPQSGTPSPSVSVGTSPTSSIVPPGPSPLAAQQATSSDSLPTSRNETSNLLQTGLNRVCDDLGLDRITTEELEEEEDEDPTAKKRRVKLSDEFLDYCVKKRVCSEHQLFRNPYTEWSRFVTHPGFNGLQSTIYNCVGSMLVGQKFRDVFTPLLGDQLREAVEERGHRIQTILMDHNKYTIQRFKFFLKALILVICRRAGKQNTFYVMGKSNAGKSQLMESFVRSYFLNAYGSPSDNDHSGFPLADCCNKRVILWEEPTVTIANFEAAKKVLGGQTLRVDQKYKPSAEVAPTPVIMTSNKPVWHNVDGEEEMFKNRMFIFNMSVPIPSDSWFIPIIRKDWDIALSTIYNDLRGIIDSE